MSTIVFKLNLMQSDWNEFIKFRDTFQLIRSFTHTNHVCSNDKQYSIYFKINNFKINIWPMWLPL